VTPRQTEAEIAEAVRAAMRCQRERRHQRAGRQRRARIRSCKRAGELTLRIFGLQPLADRKCLDDAGITAAFKGLADGSLGSTTALFYEPYLDRPETSGLANAESCRTRHRRQSQLSDLEFPVSASSMPSTCAPKTSLASPSWA